MSKRRVPAQGPDLVTRKAQSPAVTDYEEPPLTKNGSCARKLGQNSTHVRFFDFVQDRTHVGGATRALNVIDKFALKTLVILVDRGLRCTDICYALADLFTLRRPTRITKSDNAQFIIERAHAWITVDGQRSAFIEPDSPCGIVIARDSTPSFAMDSTKVRCSARGAKPRS